MGLGLQTLIHLLFQPLFQHLLSHGLGRFGPKDSGHKILQSQ